MSWVALGSLSTEDAGRQRQSLVPVRADEPRVAGIESNNQSRSFLMGGKPRHKQPLFLLSKLYRGRPARHQRRLNRVDFDFRDAHIIYL